MTAVKASPPKRPYVRWTWEDRRDLWEMHRSGWTSDEMAREMGRKPAAVRRMLHELRRTR